LTASSARYLGAALSASGMTLAVAESCTGGLVGAALTSIPGSSVYFSGGVVAYRDAAKISLLGVPPDLIATRGAVSREVALAMAEGVISLFRADLAIAVTGVAGPGGGSRGKPVGTVWVAVVAPGGVRYAHRFRFSGGREAVRRETVRVSLAAAIDLLLRGGSLPRHGKPSNSPGRFSRTA
jgi:PncC family amidohydrolase